MVGTPLDIMTGIRGVQLLVKGYNGYSKGSRIENDRLVREEIARAASRVRSHMQTVFDTQFREGNLDLARPAKRCIEECLSLIHI